MDYAKWTEHVQDCLEPRLFDTELESRVEERGLPGTYCDLVWDELHDDVRLLTLDEMVAMDMRNGSMGEYRYSEMRAALEECGVNTTSWDDSYVAERYRLMMLLEIRHMSETWCAVNGYGAYATKNLSISYVA